MVVFSVLEQKQGHGPLGINYGIQKCQFQRLKCCNEQSAPNVLSFSDILKIEFKVY